MYMDANGLLVAESGNTQNWSPARVGSTVTGTASNDVFYAADGDKMVGGAGDDQYQVWHANFSITELVGGGTDSLYSWVWGGVTLPDNVENLYLMEQGSTAGTGNALGNLIVAGPVGATLNGMGGNDVLVGGAGADTFIVQAGNGSDAIYNFTHGTDKVQLLDYQVSDFAALNALGQQVGSDVKFAMPNGESLVLRNVQLSTLTASDFRIPIDTSKLTMTFDDEFTSGLTTRDKGGVWITNYGTGWANVDHGFNGESERYVDPSYAGTGPKALGINPFSVKDGVLSITAAPATAAAAPYLGGATYTSGVISTNNDLSQLYGYYEIRAALPQGQGFWPAFWLLPESGKWPPEIDIMESLGKDAGTIYQTAHDEVNGVHTQNSTAYHIDNPTAMHTYGFNWTNDTVTWYIDGVATKTIDTPDSWKTEEFNLQLNLAVGGPWGGAPDATTGTGALKIDYVRIYANQDTVSQTRDGVTTYFHDGAPVTDAPAPQSSAPVAPPPPAGPTEGNDHLSLGDTGGTLNGLGGDDVLTGGKGNDVLDGGTGNDIMTGGAGDDSYVVDSPDDKVIEADKGGIDTVSTSLSTYHLPDWVENLVYTGTVASTLAGNTLDNVITGGAGNDPIYGDGGKDTIYGGVGNDILNGGDGDDTLYGGDGNDILIGAAGNDLLVGGAGNDIYIVDAGDTVTEAVGGGNDTVLADGSYTLAAGQEIENLQAHDQTSTTAITLTSNEFDNRLVGNAGDDILDGGAGRDVMSGGLGNDTYIVDSTGDVVIEAASAGIDTVQTTLSSYTLGANVENLVYTGSANATLNGNALNNEITGGQGNDTINGGAGADRMIGGAGNDTYLVDNVGDTVVEQAGGGTDTVNSYVTFTLGEQIENLNLFGTATVNGTGNGLNNVIGGNVADNVLSGLGGDDFINGDAGNDKIYGGSGNDILLAGAGNDVIVGGPGMDKMAGGTGADRFVFNDGDLGSTIATADQIVDFSHAQGDKIDLSGFDANPSLAGQQSFTLVSATDPHPAGSMWLDQAGNFTRINFDVNGDGKADFFLHVTSDAPLTGSDFIL